jgi:hypothetical protein
LDPRFASSNPADDYGFLRVIKISSTIFFGGKAKPSSSCCKILQHVKDPYSMIEILVDNIHGHFSLFLLLYYQVCLLVIAREF